MARILVIDNDEEERTRLSALLRHAGHQIDEAADGKDALLALRDHSYDLVLTEVLLGEMDGTAVVTYLDAQPHKPRIIAFSGGNSQIPAEMALLLVKAQVNLTLPKPFDEKELVRLAGGLLAA